MCAIRITAEGVEQLWRASAIADCLLQKKNILVVVFYTASFSSGIMRDQNHQQQLAALCLAMAESYMAGSLKMSLFHFT